MKYFYCILFAKSFVNALYEEQEWGFLTKSDDKLKTGGQCASIFVFSTS